MDKSCPNCGETYKWYEIECPECHVALVEALPAGVPTPDVQLVPIFQTNELGLLPLAKMALEQEQIEYAVRDVQHHPMVAGGRPYRGDTTQAPVEIVVRADEAERARQLLTDLETSGTPPPGPSLVPFPAPTSASGSIELFNRDTGSRIGQISHAQFAWLSEKLERESTEDEDYYIDRQTLEMLEDAKADSGLMEILRNALGPQDGVEIRWRRTTSS